MESTVTIDVDVELVCTLLKQVAYTQRLSVLCSYNERGAPIQICHIYWHSLFQKEVHSDCMSVDTSPVDRTGTIIIITVFIQWNPLLEEVVYDFVVSPKSSPVYEGVSLGVPLLDKLISFLFTYLLHLCKVSGGRERQSNFVACITESITQ